MKKVLFLCTGNACRSQMAEGWAKSLLAGKVEALSAGTRPGREVDPRAVKAMAEADVDISGQKPKRLEIFKSDNFDLVVTLCDNAREACPVYWGKAKKIHSGFDDPATVAGKGAPEEEAMPHYRRVRDEIRDFVKKLPEITEGIK
ncbi:MAG: arsenate reductase [Elusimicrobia bacterium GWC2_51_8]|nr:MAG: arsenate reductase [Elusimicrobia bacterium GWA2_51_34]OGR61523.1 MAG: arsenate reductase [Elusimicrobia bacterium GWC2_51_8]OGR85650.1 MAG: arsenate reductase [Elusimicrobia bacterium GWF2_52_66]HAF96386.1 arsenate reductase [Elusimicrobiota bacterium]HCE98573.1 arsenate reductase [Elusimicrobiota bacterium]